MAKIFFSTDELFAWTAVVILLSGLFERLVLYVLERLMGEDSGRSRSKDAAAEREG